MKVLRDLILGVFLSPEFLLVVSGAALYKTEPSVFQFVGNCLSARQEPFKWISLVPAGVVLAALKWGRDILLPKSENAYILATWSGFYVVKNRTLIGLAYIFGSVITVVSIWAFGADITHAHVSAVYVTGLAINLTAAATLWYASVQIGIRLRRVANVGK